MTRRRGLAAAAARALRALAEGFAPVCTLVGKSWALHPREGGARRSRGEPAP